MLVLLSKSRIFDNTFCEAIMKLITLVQSSLGSSASKFTIVIDPGEASWIPSRIFLSRLYFMLEFTEREIQESVVSLHLTVGIDCSIHSFVSISFSTP